MNFINKNTFSFILILLILQGTVCANDKIRLHLEDASDSSQIETKDLSLFKKSAYELIIYTNRFDLILTDNIALKGVESIILQYRVEKLIDDFSIRVAIIDGINKTTINKLHYEKVERNKLQYTFRKAIYKLFYGENYDEESAKVLKNEIIPLPKNIAPTKADIDTKSTDEEDLAVNESDDQEKEEERERKRYLEKLKAHQAKVAKQREKERKEDVKISNYASTPIETKTEKNYSNDNFKAPFKTSKNIAYTLGTGQFITQSESIIEVDTQIEYVFAKFNYELILADIETKVDFQASISKATQENKYKVSTPSLFGVDVQYYLYSNFILAGFGAQLEKISFANLSTAGEGIVPWNNTLFWMGPTLSFNTLSERLSINLKLLTAFIGQSDLGTNEKSFPIEGSKIAASITGKIYNKFWIDLEMSKLNLQSNASKEFKANTDIVQISLTYR